MTLRSNKSFTSSMSRPLARMAVSHQHHGPLKPRRCRFILEDAQHELEPDVRGHWCPRLCHVSRREPYEPDRSGILVVHFSSKYKTAEAT